jgi:hypothetical protein
MGTKSAWTAERRSRQREIIQQTKPWENSAGPSTVDGKLRSSQNARMPEHIAEALAKQGDLMAGFLGLMGRKRRPRRSNLPNLKGFTLP